jgi:type I restriction enzyme S subunit
MSEKIQNGWKWVKLGEVAEIIKGRKPETLIENPKENSLPYLTAEYFRYRLPSQFVKIEKERNLPVCEKDDIILIWDGSQAGQVFTGLKGILASTMVKIIPNLDKVDKAYLYFFLTTKFEYLNSQATGSAIPHVSKNAFLNLPIPLPPLPEQKAIAEVLSSLDDKIDLLHRQNKTLEEMAMTLFRQWFIDPAKDGLPEEWEEKALDEIAEFLNGIPSQKYPGDKLPVIKIKEMREGITENSDYCNNNIPEKYLVNSGDILFSWSGSLEVVIWFGSIGVLNQHIFKVTSLEYPKWFCYLSIKQHMAEFRAIAESKTTTMGHIQREHLSNTKVFIPPKIFFENYNKAMTPIFDKIIANNAEIQTLEKLRDTLLPKLMSGEVRVKV